MDGVLRVMGAERFDAASSFEYGGYIQTSGCSEDARLAVVCGSPLCIMTFPHQGTCTLASLHVWSNLQNIDVMSCFCFPPGATE